LPLSEVCSALTKTTHSHIRKSSKPTKQQERLSIASCST
jgi:hypothetical protein